MELTQRQVIGLALGLLVAMVTIFASQVQAGEIPIPDVYKPYILGLIAFLTATAIPSVWPHKADQRLIEVKEKVEFMAPGVLESVGEQPVTETVVGNIVVKN